MKNHAYLALALAASFATSALAQTIDYGMYPNSRLFTSTNWTVTTARLNGGSAALGTFTGGFTYDFSSKTRSQLLADFTILSGSTLSGTIGTNGSFLSGRFAVSALPTTLSLNTPLFALITTGSSLTTGDFAYIGGSSAVLSPTWLAPDPGNPLGSTIIDLQAANNKVWAGQAVFQNSSDGGITANAASSLAVVPEPSTYALLAMSGIGLAGYVVRRRRRA